MTQQIPFIGRENELARIDSLIQEWGTRRVLCIQGPGGIGKTRLLQEVRKRYGSAASAESPLMVADIIDFDDRTFHVAHNVGREIARLLGEKEFEPYFQVLLDWHRMEIGGVSAPRLEETALAVNETFLFCFNKISVHKRVVLLFDTTDALTGTDLWDYIISFTHHMTNCLIIISGRDAGEIYEKLYPHLGQDVQLIDLQPLPEIDRKSYLQQKERLLHLTIEPELAQKILFLSEGKPILLDLAAEWLARNIPLAWLTDCSLEELQSLPDDQQKQWQEEFEHQLVAPVAETRQPLDWLILIMARVYPLDVAMIAYLLDISENEASELSNESRNYVFVKSLPDGRISLHDEMRRMVNTYVWPEVDPDGDRQRQESQRAVDYLEREIELLTDEIADLVTTEQTARNSADAQLELSTFVERERSERNLWVLRGRLLDNILFTNLSAGVEAFARMFDEATQMYRLRFRETLLVSVQEYADRCSPKQRYEIDIRRVKHLLDWGEYSQAKSVAGVLLDRLDILPEWRIDILIQRGNVEVRLGSLYEAVADFERAEQISKEHTLQAWLMRALNARGWAYRNLSDYDAALEDYLASYQLSLQLNDLQQTASILNNMGYVHALMGKREIAFDQCQVALRLRQDVGSPKEVGATYSTLGEIARLYDQPAEAMTYYTKALDIFTRENDIEWMSTVRCGRGVAFLQQNELRRAEEDLKWALGTCSTNLVPQILHYLGRVYWENKELEHACEWFEKCRSLSRQIGEKVYDFRSFADLLDLYWELGYYHQWQECKSELESRYAENKNNSVRGSALRKIADLAICHGDYDAAVSLYKLGLPLTVKYTIRSSHLIGEQLRNTDQRIRSCVAGSVVSKLGTDMVQFWNENKELVTTSPEALLIFYRWQREGESRE